MVMQGSQQGERARVRVLRGAGLGVGRLSFRAERSGVEKSLGLFSSRHSRPFPRRSCGGQEPPPPPPVTPAGRACTPRRWPTVREVPGTRTRTPPSAQRASVDLRRPTAPSPPPCRLPPPPASCLARCPRIPGCTATAFSRSETLIRGRGRLGSKAATGQQARVTCRATSRLGTLCAVADDELGGGYHSERVTGNAMRIPRS